MRIVKSVRCVCLIASLAVCTFSAASEYHGQVFFSGLPVPGARVTATQGDRKVVSTTDQQGIFGFPDLLDGAWTI